MSRGLCHHTAVGRTASALVSTSAWICGCRARTEGAGRTEDSEPSAGVPVTVAVPVEEAEAADGPVRWPLGVAAITEKKDDGMTCARNTSASSSVPTKCGERFSDFIAAATENVGCVGAVIGDDDDVDSAFAALLLPSIDAPPVRGSAEPEAEPEAEPDDTARDEDEEVDDGVEEKEAEDDDEAWARNARIVSSRSRYLPTEPCDATRASAIFQKAVSSEVALPDAEADADADADEEDEDDEEEETVGNLTL